MEQPTSGSSLQIQVLSFQNQPCCFRYNGEINHHAIDNGDITSDVPVDSNYDSVTDPYTTPIKLIDDYEMDHLLEFFH